MEFKIFKNAVANQFKRMCDIIKPITGATLYRADVTKDELWDMYLSSFTPEVNPIYRERTIVDCSACRSFIKAVGNIVILNENGENENSIWDITVNEPAFQATANAMATLVKSRPIKNIFITPERTAGVDRNFEKLPQGGTQTWEHFFINIPQRFVIEKSDIENKLGDTKTLFNVLKRSLTELTNDAIITVLELIAQNSLYRGEEHKFAVESFYDLKKEYMKINSDNENVLTGFVWRKIPTIPANVAKIRNTAIGTLLIDLSIGMDLEEAVRKFESVVAPANYKRPTAIVTQDMVKRAKETVDKLGLTSALGRRYAVLPDISINDILFANRSVKKNLSDNVFDDIIALVPDKKPKSMDRIEDIPIEKFVKDILPHADSIEVMLENSHIKSLVSLIAPTDPTAELLFKWGNNFSWAYNGDMADSLREKVKAAGGNVTGDLCCRLAWWNYDDLDLHMIEPDDNHIYYFTNRWAHGTESACGGILDVDMNAHDRTREPVENIFYASRNKMKEGIYHLYVNQFARRESHSVGFESEIDFMGEVHSFSYGKSLQTDTKVTIAKFEYKRGKINILESLPSSTTSKEIWGLSTNKYHKVNLFMLSPNHWESSGSGVGNKHYFFILEGCVSPYNARGFFNEYLNEKLNEHRKVFELIGSKMKADTSSDQLSGLGFSSTQRNTLLCKVSGSFNRVIKIVF